MSNNRSIWFIVAIILAISAVGGAFWYKKSTKPIVYNNQNTEEKNLVAVVSASAQNDSDNDGLKDWEESLWGTNSFEIDSDGDGTNDGEEVSQGRNPSIKGPNDSLSAFPIGSIQQNDTNAQIREPFTDTFSKELFARYVAYKQNDKVIDPVEESSIISQMIASAQKKAVVAKQISEKDLYISTLSEKDAYNKYSLDIQQKLAPFAAKAGEESELTTLERALKSSNEADLANIEQYAKRYTQAGDVMTQIQVPRNLVATHITITNAYYKLAAAISPFSSLFQDPLFAAVNIQKYSAAKNELQNAVNDLNQILIRNNIR